MRLQSLRIEANCVEYATRNATMKNMTNTHKIDNLLKLS